MSQVIMTKQASWESTILDFIQEQSSDVNNVIFLVGSKKEEKKFHVNRFLAKTSPELARLIDEQREKEFWEVEEVAPHVFEKIVEFLYVSNIRNFGSINAKELIPLANTAERLGLHDLAELVYEQTIITTVSLKSAGRKMASGPDNAMVLYNSQHGQALHPIQDRNEFMKKLFHTMANYEEKIQAKDVRISELELERKNRKDLSRPRAMANTFSTSSQKQRATIDPPDPENDSMTFDQDAGSADKSNYLNGPSKTEKLCGTKRKLEESESTRKLAVFHQSRSKVVTKDGMEESAVSAVTRFDLSGQSEMGVLSRLTNSLLSQGSKHDLPDCVCEVVIRNCSTFSMTRRLYRGYFHTLPIGINTQILAGNTRFFGFGGKDAAAGLFCYQVATCQFVVRYSIMKQRDNDSFSFGFLPYFESLSMVPSLYRDLKNEDWMGMKDRKIVHCNAPNLKGELEFKGLRVMASMTPGPHAVLKVLLTSAF